MGQLSNYTACLCVIKETCSVCSPGWGATAPLAQAVAQLVAPRVSDLAGGSSACIACGSCQCSPAVEASNAHCKNASGLQPAELCTLAQNTCFPILLVCFLKQCHWRRAVRVTVRHFP